MSATVLYMSISLDGYVAGPNDSRENGLGDGGERLHEWVLDHAGSGQGAGPTVVSEGVNGEVAAGFMATGAVVAGRRTFEWAGGLGGDHHDGVPIFIFSRREPQIDVSAWPLVTYVDDVAEACGWRRRRPGAGTCSSTARPPPRSRCAPASSTRSSCTSSRSS